MNAGPGGGKAEGLQSRLAAGWSAMERRDVRAAEEIARAVLREDRAQIEFVRLLGASLFLQDRFREAIEPFREVFEKARTAGAGYHLGYCYLTENDSKRAQAVLEQTVREFPQMAQARNLLGICLVRESRHAEALAHFTSAIEDAPQLAEAHNNLGNALSELGRYEEALAPLEKAAQLDAGDPQAHNNLGNALFKLHRTDAAIASYRKAIALAPDYVVALGNLAAALVEENRNEEALAFCQRALALDPKRVDAHINMGLACQGLNRFDEAIECYRRALALQPESAEAHANIGLVYHRLERLEDAAAEHRRAIAIKPDAAQAHLNLGFVLLDLKRYGEAISSFQKVLAIDPRDRYAQGGVLRGEVAICKWDDFSERASALGRGVRQGTSIIDPFFFLTVSQDPEEQKSCAQGFLADRLRSRPSPLWRGERYRHEKIRVAYLSADFRDHAVGHCVRDLFGLHDRSKFEVIGVSFGADDGGALRATIARGCDRFLDVVAKDDFQTASLLRELEVDIAVDLMGFTRGCRPGILARRPAPVQVEYLGYPGSSGADFMDYLIADRFMIPEEERRHYSEQVVLLPDSYMVNHSRRVVAEPPRRGDAGLPNDGFVFCCFNNNYKITSELFDVWMRLLSKVGDSVLWLSRDNPLAEANLRKEAARRGVDPRRLVFASFAARIEEHYARYRLADLFLDTPYNGHVTAADALWAGLPVLTCPSRAFAGRVAGSLLHSLGLPELVTRDRGEYEAMALRLAGDRNFLDGLHARLERNKRSGPLFDTDRFRRHIESAFTTMREIRERGEEPRAFSVAPIE
jgi:predicted O-linked N-acetylglucosamine transferase (SPINDLY family)